MKYVVTHSFCNDGLGSAWVFKKFIPDIQIIFSSFSYEWKKIEFKKDDFIYFADFSPQPNEAIELLNMGVDFIVLDHHATALEKLERFADKDKIKDKYIFDMNKCGSLISWEYLFKKKLEDGLTYNNIFLNLFEDNEIRYSEETGIPHLLKFIDIGDRWDWDKAGYSREVCKYIGLKLEMNNIESFDKLVKEFDLNTAIDKGILLKEYQDHLVESLKDSAYILDFDGVKVAALNESLFMSEIGHELCALSPSGLGMVYYINAPEKFAKVSVRGIGAKKFCERYKGGGHELASGFTMNIYKFLSYLKHADKIKKMNS